MLCFCFGDVWMYSVVVVVWVGNRFLEGSSNGSGQLGSVVKLGA